MSLAFGTFHLFERAGESSEQAAITEQLDLIEAAERLGYDSAWVAEHHFGDYGVCPSATLALAAAAARTSRIRLGSGVVVLPFHNPLRVAEELAFVDQLSGGRLDVGLGRGYRQKELSGFGIELADTRGIFAEAVEVLRKAWTEQRLTHEGEHFRFADVEVRPRPVQQPHPRLWVGSLSPETFELVGRLQAHLLFTPRFSPEEDIPRQIAGYREAIRAGGGDPDAQRVGALRFVYCAPTSDEARRDFEPSLRWFFGEAATQNQALPGEQLSAEQEQYRRDPDVDLDQLIEAGNVVVGDPQEVADRLEAMQAEWGLTDLILWTRVGGLPTAKVERSLQLIAEQVRPRFA